MVSGSQLSTMRLYPSACKQSSSSKVWPEDVALALAFENERNNSMTIRC